MSRKPWRRRCRRRKLTLEALEPRQLLAFDIQFSGESTSLPGVPLEAAVEIDTTINFDHGFDYQDAGPFYSRMFGERAFSLGTIQVDAIRDAAAFDDMLYVIGNSAASSVSVDSLAYQSQAVAFEFNLQTNESRAILLNSLSDANGDGKGYGFVHSVAEVGEQIVFAGWSSLEPWVGPATTWDLQGAPTRVSLSTEFAGESGVVFDVTSRGIMTGWQIDHDPDTPSSVGIVASLGGETFVLPEHSSSSGYQQPVGRTATVDGRYVIGSIEVESNDGTGVSVVVWKSAGVPGESNYELMQFGYDSTLDYRLEPGVSAAGTASGPVSVYSQDGYRTGPFVVESVPGRPLLLANYWSFEGEQKRSRVGAWSIADGRFLRDFGYGEIQDVIEYQGEVFVATNDRVSAGSGALWNLKDSTPLYLTELLEGEQVANPYFTAGSLFATEVGLGMVGSGMVGGAKTNFIGQLEYLPDDEIPADAVLDFHVDSNGDGNIDFVHQGNRNTQLPLTYSNSGSYNVVARAVYQGRVVAEGSTTVEIAPYRPGTHQIGRHPMDINGDSRLSPLDALRVINYLNRVQAGEAPHPLYDVDLNGSVGPLDALLIINRLNRSTGETVTFPPVTLSNDTGVTGDGLSSEFALQGSGVTEQTLFLSHNGTTREISERLSDGVFSLPQSQLNELFGPLEEGEHQLRLLAGDDRRLFSLVKFAIDSEAPEAFQVHTPVRLEDDRLRFQWTMAVGASRYQVQIRRAGEAQFSALGEPRRTEWLVPETALPSGVYELRVLARDAAGNQTYSNTLEFAI